VAPAAVSRAVQIALEDLALHRLQAATLLRNHASQRVLEKNGFERIGVARDYLRIAGRWQDHILFGLVAA
jgi:ribosomal-protein-alanine N-acetyltransferase